MNNRKEDCFETYNKKKIIKFFDHDFHSMFSTLRFNANLVFLVVPEGNCEELSRRGGNYGLPSENLQHQQSITGKLRQRLRMLATCAQKYNRIHLMKS